MYPLRGKEMISAKIATMQTKENRGMTTNTANNEMIHIIIKM